jgi:hypothetical protein
MQALVDEETMVKMINFAYNIFRDPKMEAEFLRSQPEVYVMQAELCVSVCVCVCGE